MCIPIVQKNHFGQVYLWKVSQLELLGDVLSSAACDCPIAYEHEPDVFQHLQIAHVQLWLCTFSIFNLSLDNNNIWVWYTLNSLPVYPRLAYIETNNHSQPQAISK